MSKDKPVFLYVTLASKEEGEKISKLLLEKRLCACVNIYSGIKSYYWWEGKIESSEEAVMIVKTKESLSEEATSLIKSNHSYSVPCVAKLEVEITFKPFEEWLFKETK